MNVLYNSFHGPRNMSGFWSFPLISFLLDLSLSGFANGPQHCMRSAQGELSFHQLSRPLTEMAFLCASMSQPKSRIVWPLRRLCFRLPQSALPQPPHMMAAEVLIPPVCLCPFTRSIHLLLVLHTSWSLHPKQTNVSYSIIKATVKTNQIKDWFRVSHHPYF